METMKNAHEHFGVLEYTKRTKDTTTRIRLRLDRFIGEVDNERNCKAHLISALGGDSDVGAIWAAVIEQNQFTVEAPGIESLTATLGEGALCFRGTITVADCKPIRHLVAISAELTKTRPGADPQGKRTVLCDSDPTAPIPAVVTHSSCSVFHLKVYPGVKPRAGHRVPPPRQISWDCSRAKGEASRAWQQSLSG
jgi:hypothetical protein